MTQVDVPNAGRVRLREGAWQNIVERRAGKEKVKHFAKPILAVINLPCSALEDKESFEKWSEALPDLFSSELNLVNPQWVLIFDLTKAITNFSLKAEGDKKSRQRGREPERNMTEWEMAKFFVRPLKEKEKYKVAGGGFSLHAVDVNVDPARVGVPATKKGNPKPVEVSVWECRVCESFVSFATESPGCVSPTIARIAEDGYDTHPSTIPRRFPRLSIIHNLHPYYH